MPRHPTPPAACARACTPSSPTDWIRGACVEHVVTVLADDDIALGDVSRAWASGTMWWTWSRTCVPVAARAAAGGRDDPARRPSTTRGRVVDLDAGLRRHLEASPVFLRLGPPPPLEVHRRRLGDPASATFVAERDGGARGVPAHRAVRDGRRARSCATRAPRASPPPSPRPALRGCERGDRASSPRRSTGRAGRGTCAAAVDHESANGEAVRFWARHATPVAISLSRRLAPGTCPEPSRPVRAAPPPVVGSPPSRVRTWPAILRCDGDHGRDDPHHRQRQRRDPL